MTNKQVKLHDNRNRRSGKTENAIEAVDQSKLKKTELFPDEEANRMSEKSRAFLINQIIGSPDEKLSNEFASYFYASDLNSDSPYSMTSHKILPRLENLGKALNKPTVPAYPSVVQSLRWSPHLEVSTADKPKYDVVDNIQKFNCRCENCAMKTCPSKAFYSNTIKPKIFKDNIMTFRDQYTMTPKLNDACCGIRTPLSSPKVSDVSVTASNVTVRDTQTRAQIQQVYTPPTYSPQVIKNSECEEPVYKEYGYGHSNYLDEAVRDTDVSKDYHEAELSKSMRAPFIFKNKPCANHPHFEQYDNSRKVLYNEGISDMVASHYPITPVSIPSTKKVIKDCSRISVMSKCCAESEDTIPSSHRSESRYHNSCKRLGNKHFHYDSNAEDARHLIARPKMAKKTFTSQPIKRFRTPFITLPKKVLTSERDIEAYIDKSSQDIPSRVARKDKKS
ncbi:uncharacterized protein ACR2FA_002287 [Aphomia sociella]